MTTMRFSGRTPSPLTIAIGQETDQNAEQIRFRLPQIAEGQAATLQMILPDGTPDVLDIEDGMVTVPAASLTTAGRIRAWVEILGGEDVAWHSEVFYMDVGELPPISEEVERQYPTALENAISQTTENKLAAQAAQSVAEAAAAYAAASATAAAGSASDASTSATAAAGSASDASTSATAAAGSASTASGNATAARISATAAAGSETAAAGSADNAAASATAAAGSASDAASSATAAAASASKGTEAQAMIGPTEASTTASAPHAAGSYFILAGTLYEALTDIAAGDSIVTSGDSQNCEPAKLGEELSETKDEFNEIKDELYKNKMITVLTGWNAGKLIATLANSVIGPVVDNVNYRYIAVPCKKGDAFRINVAGSGRSAVRVYAFTKSDGTIIRRGWYTDYVNEVIVAPDEAAYLYINDKNSGEKCYKEAEYLKILCIGNSFTSDSITYAPALIKNIAGDGVIFGKVYYSGARITQYINWFDNDSAVLTYHKYDPDASRWGDGQSNKTLKEILADQAWDIITFSPGYHEDLSGTPESLNELLYKVTNYCADVHGKGIKAGWLMPHMRPEGYNRVTYEDCVELMQNVLTGTAVDFTIPCLTAIENARGTSLNNIGSGSHGGMTADDNDHLQAGIPALVSCYTTALSVLQLIGKSQYGILQNPIRPTDEWIASQQAFHHGSSMGVTDDNCYIAQKCAIAAMKIPYKISTVTEAEIPNP